MSTYWVEVKIASTLTSKNKLKSLSFTESQKLFAGNNLNSVDISEKVDQSNMGAKKCQSIDKSLVFLSRMSTGLVFQME